MTTPDLHHPEFVLGGRIGWWDPRQRRLEISGNICWVAPEVPVWGVQAGIWATAIGYRDDRTDRWIVTVLTLG